MFGMNDIASRRPWDGKYRVQEVFYTIQGEGPLTGLPAVFVRLWGCNLRCRFCDTDFTTSNWVPSLEELMADISDKASSGRARAVVITGGEPMLQEIGPLCVEIVTRLGLQVQIETAGTVWPTSFDDPIPRVMFDQEVITFVCSPKTGRVHERVLERCKHWKYIIGADAQLDEFDGLPAESTQGVPRHLMLQRPPMDDARHTIWVQPQEEHTVSMRFEHASARSVITGHVRNDELSRASIARTVQVAMQYGYRVSLQTHKLLGLP